jgi:hypothetical protein
LSLAALLERLLYRLHVKGMIQLNLQSLRASLDKLLDAIDRLNPAIAAHCR